MVGKYLESDEVHFRISLREMLISAGNDAKYRRKNMPVATLIEPAVG